jgi:hypothetical protein
MVCDSSSDPMAATYHGTSIAAPTDPGASHLGGNAIQGDPFTHTPLAWRYLVERFAVRTALDVGSGRGYAALNFSRLGVITLAVDGFIDNVLNSVYPAVCHDLTASPFVTRVDLVHCQEVVEHIEEEHVQNLIDTFKSGRFLCMTHALPGQDGHHHVNCQAPDYWIDLMTLNGFSLLTEDTKRVRYYAERDNGHYLAQTALVFANTSS